MEVIQGSFLFDELPVEAASLHDEQCRAVTSAHPNTLVPLILSASYAYSWLDCPIISDGLYDRLARDLAELWDQVQHFHKHLLQREWFPKGSVPMADGEYPSRIVFATKYLLSSRREQ